MRLLTASQGASIDVVDGDRLPAVGRVPRDLTAEHSRSQDREVLKCGHVELAFFQGTAGLLVGDYAVTETLWSRRPTLRVTNSIWSASSRGCQTSAYTSKWSTG